jgi:hypothetical protein
VISNTDAREDAGNDVEKWSISQKRVMVTHVVAEAWNQFCTEKKSLIAKLFINIGLNIVSNRSDDPKLASASDIALRVEPWQLPKIRYSRGNSAAIFSSLGLKGVALP